MKDPSAVYIHIPFCNKICPFCSFAVIRDGPTKHADYVDMIQKEFRMIVKEFNLTFTNIQSVYFGGGTPSRLPPALLSSLVEWLHTVLPLTSETQWAIEVNPEDVSKMYSKKLIQLGFNRVSIGIQSFLPQGLQLLGRVHLPHQSRDAIKTLREAGFEDINLDLIFGYPNQTREMLMTDLEEYTRWAPTHMSVYALTIEEKTNFARKPEIKRWQLENEDLISQMYETIVEYLKRHEMNHYEISNFAKPGFESLQNQIYWNGLDYLGLGLGAHSLISPHRWGNHRRWVDYRKCLAIDKLPILAQEELGPMETMNEELMIQLRLAGGLDLKRFAAKYGLDLETLWQPKLDDLANAGLAEIRDKNLILTTRGQLLADEITASLASLLP